MKNLAKRGLSLLLILAMCISLTVGMCISVASATTIANWGVRGAVALSPSEYISSFYTGSYTFDALMSLEGSTSSSPSTVAQSELYDALQTLMTDNHTNITSYDETRSLYQYTDCQNGNVSAGISSFYSGVTIGPAWDSGSTWNREHTWPNSKGLNGSDENDIMMLRPTSVSENSSRGNDAYGESSGYYNPNSEANGKYDLRGDVARIMLYVFVRWGNTNLFGTGGVLESREVMLAWIEADPVDTWELGRVDSVQSITGTRNVFVDYPELAFRLFGEEVPADMTTPSGEGDTGSGGSSSTDTYKITYSENGVTRSSDISAGDSILLSAPDAETLEGWDFSGWVTKTVNETTGKPATVYAAGESYKPTANTTFYALYTQLGTGGGIIKLTDASSLKVGDELIFGYAEKGVVAGDMSSTTYLPTVNATFDNGTITSLPTDAAVFTLGGTEGAWTLTSAKGSLAITANSNGKLAYSDTNNTWDITFTDGVASVVNLYSSGTRVDCMRYNTSSPRFANYATTSTMKPIELYLADGTAAKYTTQVEMDYYTVSFSVPEGVAAIEPMQTANGKVTLPDAKAPIGSTFVGWVTESVDNAAAKPSNVYTGDFAPDANVTLYALYSIETEGAGAGNYTLVTDIATLAVGDKIVIAAAGYNFALSTTQNGNNRSQAAITKNSDNTITIGEDTQILTLQAGAVADTWAFYTGSGYLYAASSGSNYLRTETSLSNNSSFLVTIEADGTATAIAQGSYTRNNLMYNSMSSIFSCYKSGQKPISLYKFVAGGKATVWSTNVVCAHERDITTDGTHQWLECPCGNKTTGPVISLGAKINADYAGGAAIRFGAIYNSDKAVSDLGMLLIPTAKLGSNELTLEYAASDSLVLRVRAAGIEGYVADQQFEDYTTFTYYVNLTGIDEHLDAEITVVPYVVYEDGSVVYAEAFSRSYNSVQALAE